MKLIRSIKGMQSEARRIAHSGCTIGLVPTMGSLHEGHLSLIKRAAKGADVVITTIFVNPTQFAPTEDLSNYPRSEREDIKKIKATLGDKEADAIVFLPKPDDIYPDDFQSWVTVEKLSLELEGKRRRSHFQGVTTIVAKLFNIMRPDLVIFGQKDYQQAIVLKQMCRDLNYPIKFIIAPTVREADGLAMSSRNRYFNDQARWEAVCLFYALKSAKSMVESGIKNCETIEEEMRAVIKAICKSAKIHYIVFTDFNTLLPMKSIKSDTIVSLAVLVHGVDLIDNIRLK